MNVVVRRAATCGLFMVAGVLLVSSILLLYGRITLFSPERFSDRAISTLQEPAVRTALSEQIVNGIVAEGDPDLIAVRPLLISVTESVVQTNAFQELFRDALVQTHSSVFEGNRSTLVLFASNAVVLVTAALETINPKLARRIPKGTAASVVKLSDSHGFSNAAAFAGKVRRAAIPSLLLGILALIGAIAMSTNRFRAIRTAGMVVAGGALMVLVGDQIIGARLVADTNHSLQAAVHDSYSIITAPLRRLAYAYIGAGVVMAIATLAATKPADLEQSLMSLARPFLKSLTAPARSGKMLAARAVVVVSSGLLLVAWPATAVKIVAIVAGVFLLAQGVRDVAASALGPERLVAEAAAKHVMSRKALSWLGGGIAAIVVTVVTVGALTADPGPLVPTLKPRTACNGSDALCARPLAGVTLPATHNSMSSASDRNWLFPEQDNGIVSQLNDGVRGLLVDVNYGYPGEGGVLSDVDFNNPGTKNEAVRSFGPAFVDAANRLRHQLVQPGPGTAKQLYMCHSFCELGALPLVPTLGRIRDWLYNNRREVVVIIVEDYAPAPEVIAAFDSAGLSDYAYGGPITEAIPMLGKLIKADKRLIVFSEHAGRQYDWYRPAFSYIQETPFNSRSLAAMSCRVGRGTATNPLFLINNWVDSRPASLVSNARRANAPGFLLARARKCARVRKHTPNLVAVDWYRKGDVFGVVNELNKSSLRTPEPR